MTKSQVRRYVRDLEEKRRIAKEKLEKAKKTPEYQKDKEELCSIENIIDEL
jgi:hypothetical protein